MRTAILAFLSLVLTFPALADELAVSPGKDAVNNALAKAKAGDVVRLAAGDYNESVSVPAEVALQGAGADKTTITGVSGATINCQGPGIRVTGLTVKGSEEAFRGVNADSPVRIERCRFVGVREGVGMMQAPLSDIVACEFIDCGIGVRAIGAACPTVWGCSFKGGNIGVFCMEGSPYIRNNLFQGVRHGVRILPDNPAIIRNNVFLDCEASAVTVMSPRSAVEGPSIRNNTISGCGAAVVVPAGLAAGITHNLYTGVKAPAFHDEEGKEVSTSSNAEADTGVTVSDAREVKLARPELAENKGIRLSTEGVGTAGTIGLEKPWRKVGAAATAPFPPDRFSGKMFIANAVAEEYQYLQILGRPMASQGLGTVDGVRVDILTPEDGKTPAKLTFDISRFFGESNLKP